MKELNLEVGQKVWTIQLGDCEVSEKHKDFYLLKNKSGVLSSYQSDLKYYKTDAYRSVFESNPFEPKLVQENKDGWIEPKENKADLIKSLCTTISLNALDGNRTIIEIARGKLQKLLDTL